MKTIKKEFSNNNELIKLVQYDNMYQVLRDIYYNKESAQLNIPISLPCTSLEMIEKIYETSIRKI